MASSLVCITPRHRITSHRITPYHIVSHRITSYSVHGRYKYIQQTINNVISKHLIMQQHHLVMTGLEIGDWRLEAGKDGIVSL